MKSLWQFDKCFLCTGKGKILAGTLCPICKGFGLWEFVSENNHLAVVALLSGEAPANLQVKAICDRRLAQVTPDNLNVVIAIHEKRKPTEADFDALHDAGAKKWGWAWVHANRFAIELVRLCGGNPTEHKLALSRVAWKWLSEENQIKIDAPIDIPELDAL